MAFTPSPQQQAVLEWTTHGSGSAIVVAVAGAGKTTTLIELLKRTTGSVAFMAFNKKIADEIKVKIARAIADEPELASVLDKRIRVGTVHSFGLAALRQAYPRATTDEKKLQILADEIGVPMDLREFVLATAAMAKKTGIGILSPFASRESWLEMVAHHDLDLKLPEGNRDMTTALRLACQLLKASNEACSEVDDFDDMIYIPLLKGLRMWQNDWVLIDEAQDTNGTRRALAKAMLKPGGRLVAVGDPAQAIYGFTGADSDSLEMIRKEFNTQELPLTVTYRCPKSVVAVAQEWVSHIQAHETAPEGVVSHLIDGDFWGTKENPGMFAGLTADDSVLCRNTKPLISLAYGLLRRGVGCQVEGREIGTGLLKLASKWRKIKTISELREKLEEYKIREITKAMAKSQESRAEAIADQVETLFEIMSQFADDESVSLLKPAIEKLFGDTPAGQRPKVATLSTIHKAKGREWKRVFWWGKNAYQPSKYARQEWQLGQERNLMYVAATRAQEELIFINVEG